MNPLLSHLQPYPFERLRQLFAGVTPPAAYSPISLGMGEPRHPTPQFIKDALSNNLEGLASYPATAGEPRLREAFTRWLNQRYALTLDAGTQVLPVNGSREALFAFAQAIIDPSQGQPLVVCPNPFYQIYEGAALLAGAQPYYAPSDPARNFAVNWDTVPESVWERTQLLFVCSPGNPTGAVMPLSEWKKLFALSDRYGPAPRFPELARELVALDVTDHAAVIAFCENHAIDLVVVIVRRRRRRLFTFDLRRRPHRPPAPPAGGRRPRSDPPGSSPRRDQRHRPG